MNKQDVLKTQSCVLRVNIHCHGCRSKVKKILQKIDGVYSVTIDAEQGKVEVTGSVDPQTLIKRLEKNGKHAELWSPPSNKGSNLNNNQFKNFQFDGGKLGKEVNNNTKGPKGGKEQQKGGGGGQQQLLQQQQLQQLQQMHMLKQQQLQQQVKGTKAPLKEQKNVKFNLPEDDYDSEFDDEDDYGSEFDDEDDEGFDDGLDDGLDDDMYGGGHHGHAKNMPVLMGGGHGGKGGGGGGGGDGKKGKDSGGGGGGEKKGKEGGGGGGKKGGGGGGGMASIFKGMLGGGGGGESKKKGGDGKKDGKKDGGKNKGGGGGDGKDKSGGGGGGKNGKSGGGVNHKGDGGKKGGGGGGGGGGGLNDLMGSIENGKMGGQTMSIPQMGPAAGMSAPHMMNAGGGNYPGMGPPTAMPYGNPQQQQYMAMMMNQQRMNGGGGGDGYGMHQQQPMNMMYGRAPMGVGYAPTMVPPPGYHDPFSSYFSDENTDSCSIM